MRIEAAIREKLMIGLQPVKLDVVNESHLHAGHLSSPGTGQSHFRVFVVAEKFSGLNRLERHRLVNSLIAEEFEHGLHALAISARAPDEAGD